MSKGAVTHWFGEHLTKVLLGLLCSVVLAAWIDMRGEVKSAKIEFEARYASKDMVDQRVEVINLSIAANKVQIEAMNGKIDTQLNRIADRLEDIGDRLGRIEGRLGGTP